MAMAKQNPQTVYQLKVTLRDSKPPIWRRLLVDSDITLPRLHRALQIAMGWQDYHIHAFRVDDEAYGVREGDMDCLRDETHVKLNRLLRREKDSLIYEYDFGDGWEHKVLLEKILPPDDALATPRCIKGKRACPPEDCGGIYGYCELLDTLADPAHPDREEMLEWLGGAFEPETFSLDAANERLKREFER
jgi:hypothetical protein